MSDTVKKQLEALKAEERKTGNSGAVPNTPKQTLLDASDVAAKKPDKHLRWVSTAGDGQKAEIRRADGYVTVPEAEGGRRVGSLVLMETSKEHAEEKRARIAKVNQARLDAHNREVEAAAEAAAKFLRDRHGINVDTKDILIKE